MAVLPPERSHNASTDFGGRTDRKNPTLSTKEKNKAGKFQKDNSRSGFSDWTHASFTGTGVKSEPARLSFYARNRFELWHILPPKPGAKDETCYPVGWHFKFGL